MTQARLKSMFDHSNRNLRGIGVAALLMLTTACEEVDDSAEFQCDDTCALAQEPYAGEVAIAEGIVGYSLFESDVSVLPCGAPCEVYNVQLQVAAVDEDLDLEGLRALLADTSVSWTTYPVEGQYELALVGPVALCWQFSRGSWPNPDYRVVCSSFTIEPSEVWTVHPFGWFSDVGRLFVFDPAGVTWPSETFRPSSAG